MKQLLTIGEQRMIEASLDNLHNSRCDEIIVVLGFAADQIRPLLEGKERIKVVINPRFAEGMSTSIHKGLNRGYGEISALHPGTFRQCRLPRVEP